MEAYKHITATIDTTAQQLLEHCQQALSTQEDLKITFTDQPGKTLYFEDCCGTWEFTDGLATLETVEHPEHPEHLESHLTLALTRLGLSGIGKSTTLPGGPF